MGGSHRKLGRPSAHRWAMLRTLVNQLVVHERIETTLPRAKELKRLADRMITISKEGGINARRKARKILRTDEAMHKLFTEHVQRYKDRDGGYTRVLQTRQRSNDRAHMAFIEYVDRPGELRQAKPPSLRGASTLLPKIVQPMNQ